MSTNKSNNFKLHVWESGDNFLRSEFNENFAKLDDASRAVFGTFTGDGQGEQFINLGFTPKAVIVFSEYGATYNDMNTYGGLAIPGYPVKYSGVWAVMVVVGGFRVYGATGNYGCYPNLSGYTSHFVAFR